MKKFMLVLFLFFIANATDLIGMTIEVKKTTCCSSCFKFLEEQYFTIDCSGKNVVLSGGPKAVFCQSCELENILGSSDSSDGDNDMEDEGESDYDGEDYGEEGDDSEMSGDDNYDRNMGGRVKSSDRMQDEQ